VTKVLGRLALIALVVFVGVTLWYGQMEQQLQPPATIATGKSAPTPTPALTANEPLPASQDYAVIVKRNIFQALPELGAKAGGGASPAELEKTVETKMQLVLLGTVTGSEADARAIIRDDQAKVEDIYRVGSTISGAAITRIGRGKVVLQVNGREEILTIKEPDSGGSSPGSSASVVSPAAVQTAPVSERPVPEALPRRRISFRNPASASPAAAPPPAPTTPEEGEVAPAPSGSDQGTPADSQPQAETGAPQSDNSPAPGAEQQAQ